MNTPEINWSEPHNPADLIVPNPAAMDPLWGFDVEYYEYECGQPCTPDGCLGHSTAIPLSFSVGGVTFHVDGAQSGDFPDEKESVDRVCTVVAALEALVRNRTKQ